MDTWNRLIVQSIPAKAGREKLWKFERKTWRIFLTVMNSVATSSKADHNHNISSSSSSSSKDCTLLDTILCLHNIRLNHIRECVGERETTVIYLIRIRSKGIAHHIRQVCRWWWLGCRKHHNSRHRRHHTRRHRRHHTRDNYTYKHTHTNAGTQTRYSY